jgi:hypothetical protein
MQIKTAVHFILPCALVTRVSVVIAIKSAQKLTDIICVNKFFSRHAIYDDNVRSFLLPAATAVDIFFRVS